MLELLVPNAAKATMAEEHKFLESGNWEKATSIARSNAYSGGGPAWHQLSQGCPAALPSTDAEEASCISNPKGDSGLPRTQEDSLGPGKTRVRISLMMGWVDTAVGTLEGWQLSKAW